MNEEIKIEIEIVLSKIVTELAKTDTDKLLIAKNIRECRLELEKIDCKPHVKKLVCFKNKHDIIRRQRPKNYCSDCGEKL